MLKLSSKAIEEMGHFLNDNAELIQRAQPWLLFAIALIATFALAAKVPPIGP